MLFGMYTCRVQGREGEIWGSNPHPKHAVASDLQKDDLLFTKCQHRSAIQYFTELFRSLLHTHVSI